MIASYGYKDGSGDYFIAIDSDKCNGCGACVPACPGKVLDVGEDPNDPLREIPVSFVQDGQRQKLKDTCAPCKPDHDRRPPPCVEACEGQAIEHSW